MTDNDSDRALGIDGKPSELIDGKPSELKSLINNRPLNEILRAQCKYDILRLQRIL
jgi:hypothetical protein